MNWTDLLSRATEITSNFNLEISIILFLLCSIGEVGFALPYILETIWLLAGYQLTQGTLQPVDLFLIWLVAQAGRQTGSLALYFSGRLGMLPLKKIYKKYVEPRMPKRQIIPAWAAKRIKNPSPFSVAIGRLVGLRVPMALAMSAVHKLPHLALGVILSSIIWDGAYLIIGATVGTAGSSIVSEPQYMLLYSLGGLTAVYLITLGIRFLFKSRNPKQKPVGESDLFMK